MNQPLPSLSSAPRTLQPGPVTSDARAAWEVTDAGGTIHGLSDLSLAIFRARWVLLLWLMMWLAGALLYTSLVRPQFTASTLILLEPRRDYGVGREDSSNAYPPTLDSAQAESQIEVVKSERVLSFVFDTLQLADGPDFARPPIGPWQRLRGLVSGLLPQATTATLSPRARAFQTFSDRITVRRLGQSYVLEISYWAADPANAARMANAITAAYIRAQVLWRTSEADHGVAYLQGRIENVKAELDAAAEAVRNGAIPDIQFPDSSARVISAALEPLDKSFPRTWGLLGLAVTLGMITGLGTILLRFSVDRRIRSSADVWRHFGIDCLATVPRFARRRALRPGGWRMVVDDPASAFAEGMRSARATIMAAQYRGDHACVGFVGCGRRAGVSTLASNFAHLLADAGEPVTLLDADLRNPDLTRAMAPEASCGLSDVLDGHPPHHLAQMSLYQGLQFAPAVAGGQVSRPNVYLGSREMQMVLAGFRGTRTLVIDLPDMRSSSNAQAASPLLDGIVLVVEANRTTIDEVRTTIRELSLVGASLLGIVLNKAEPRSRL